MPHDLTYRMFMLKEFHHLIHVLNLLLCYFVLLIFNEISLTKEILLNISATILLAYNSRI